MFMGMSYETSLANNDVESSLCPPEVTVYSERPRKQFGTGPMVCLCIAFGTAQSAQRIFFTPLKTWSLVWFIWFWLLAHVFAATAIVWAVTSFIRRPKNFIPPLIAMTAVVSGLLVWWFAPVSDVWLRYIAIR